MDWPKGADDVRWNAHGEAGPFPWLIEKLVGLGEQSPRVMFLTAVKLTSELLLSPALVEYYLPSLLAIILYGTTDKGHTEHQASKTVNFLGCMYLIWFCMGLGLGLSEKQLKRSFTLLFRRRWCIKGRIKAYPVDVAWLVPMQPRVLDQEWQLSASSTSWPNSPKISPMESLRLENKARLLVSLWSRREQTQG